MDYQKRWEIIEEIDQGGQGKVYRVINKDKFSNISEVPYIIQNLSSSSAEHIEPPNASQRGIVPIAAGQGDRLYAPRCSIIVQNDPTSTDCVHIGERRAPDTEQIHRHTARGSLGPSWGPAAQLGGRRSGIAQHPLHRRTGPRFPWQRVVAQPLSR